MDAVEIAKQLIAIPSVTGHELEMSEHLLKAFNELGCRTSLIEVQEHRFNVFAEMEGEDGGELGVLFYGHMDTVPPYTMKDPFEGIIRNGALWGRGTVDQKGGIAAVLAAFGKLRADGVRPHKSIGFLGVVDEEAEHRGIMKVSFPAENVRCAVVTEPSGLKLGVGCKGTMPIKITVLGKAAHGCRPWLGTNAVWHAMKIVEGLLEAQLPSITIGNLGKTKATLSLGILGGGDAYNIVPDNCTAFLDRRTLPGEDQRDIMEYITRKLKQYEQDNGVRVRLEIDRPDWNWDPIRKRGLKPALQNTNSEVVRVFQAVHSDLIGQAPILFFTDGYHEGDFFINDMHIETVQYGPGDSKYAHTDDEHVPLNELRTAAEVYEEAAKRLSNRP